MARIFIGILNDPSELGFRLQCGPKYSNNLLMSSGNLSSKILGSACQQNFEYGNEPNKIRNLIKNRKDTQ